MSRMVQCIKLKKELEGLEFPPYPGDVGVKIWQSVSKEAWASWVAIQTRIVNENHLNLADARSRKYLAEQMQQYLFEDQDIEAQGYVPPAD